MREIDLIMGRFADAEIGNLSETELDQFEALIEVQDRDLLSWLTGEAEVPVNQNTAVFHRLKAFHRHDAPIHS
jgi:antitoxin CptB